MRSSQKAMPNGSQAAMKIELNQDSMAEDAMKVGENQSQANNASQKGSIQGAPDKGEGDRPAAEGEGAALLHESTSLMQDTIA